MMWCGREEEDEEARARWGMCIEAVALYNGSTPDPFPSRDFGETTPDLLHSLPKLPHASGPPNAQGGLRR